VAATKKPSTEATATAVGDGRHARAERTRDAIVDALLSLLEAGEVRPSAERVAERAGVSRRVLFHHFTDLEDLRGRVATRRFQTLTSLWPALSCEGSLEERILEFVSRMSRFYEQVAPVRRAAIFFAAESPVIASFLRDAERLHRGAVEFVFGQEISNVESEKRATLIASLAAVTSFSFWEELRRAQSLAEDNAIVVVTRLCWDLLSSEKEKTRKP
jgi:AcrR family transcriptional regulator